jgi:hypothetical protein
MIAVIQDPTPDDEWQRGVRAAPDEALAKFLKHAPNSLADPRWTWHIRIVKQEVLRRGIMPGSEGWRRRIAPPAFDVFKEKLTDVARNDTIPAEFLVNILKEVRIQEPLNPEWKAHREFLEKLLRKRGISF